MQPRRLILRNFGPFSSLKYDFVNESIAIIGENRTQDDQLSNGSGKSSISQGLFYGIYGVNLRGVLDKNLSEKVKILHISVFKFIVLFVSRFFLLKEKSRQKVRQLSN